MLNERNLAKILKFLIYASAFVPLVIFSQFMSPFHFGKVIVFRSLVEMMLVFYLLLVWRNRSYWLKWNKITWAFFIFTAAFSLTSFTSINVYQSFWGTLERMGGLWTFWHYFVFYIILVSVIRNRNDWLRLLKLTVLIGILSALYGFGQKTDMKFFIGGGNRARIFGTIGNTALFAGYQLLVLFLSLSLLLRGKSNTINEKLIYGFGFVLTFIAVLMTAVRGSLLAMGIGLILFFILYSVFFRSKQGRKVVFALVASVLFFVSFALIFNNTPFVKNSRYLTRLTDFSLNSYTVQTRFWAWQAGFNGWNDSVRTIVLGWGPENFNIPFSKYFNPKFYEGPGSETLFDRAHNMFVEILVTMGLLGLATYLGLFVAVFFALKKAIKKHPENMMFGIGMISLTVAYMIHNSFIFDTSANFIAFFTIMGFISSLAYDNNTNIDNGQNPPASGKGRKLSGINAVMFTIAGIIMFIAVSVLIYKTNIIPLKANYATTRGIIRGWAKDFGGAVEKFKKAAAYESFGKYEIRHKFAEFVLNFVSSGKINEDRAAILKDIIEEVKKNAQENDQDYLPLLYLSRLNIVLGKDDPNSPYNDTALEYSRRALDISPTFIRTYYEVAQAYLNKKDREKAVEYFKKAAELNSNVGVTYWYWGVTEFEKGDVRIAAEIISKAMEKGYNLSEDDANRAVNIYLKVGDSKKLVYVFQQLIFMKPDNPQYRASLATVFAQTGQIDKALEQAREAVRIDPSFEAEARVFAKQLGRELY